MNEELNGGLVICRPQLIRIDSRGIDLQLMSDLHIGSPYVDYDLIAEELSSAADDQARISINGDILDNILPSDKKRYEGDALHPRLQGRKDVVNEAVAWALEILGPYAKLIDMVGTGNHESALEKHHSIDTTRMIVEGLNRKGGRVSYGGYTGFLDYRLLMDRTKYRYVIFYHHGAGTGGSITRTLSSLTSKSWAGADLYWEGHRHTRLSIDTKMVECSVDGYKPKVRPVRFVSTGAYFSLYSGQSQKSIRENGRRALYAADVGVQQMGCGGARVHLFPWSDGQLRVTVTQ